jgi:DNA-binding IclR family transcriptional regulator
MAIANQHVVNEHYEPTEKDEQILAALKRGRGEGKPWGRANPRWLVEETGLSKSNVEFCLRSLRDAGWIRRVARGLYELVEDPRQRNNDD